MEQTSYTSQEKPDYSGTGNQARKPSRMKAMFQSSLFWILGPVGLLFLIMIAYPVVTFISIEAGPQFDTVALVVRAILGLLGLIAVLGLFIGFPMALVMRNKKRNKKIAQHAHHMDPRSGLKEKSTIPPEIRGWNWGAAGLTWIWGLTHGVWISLLAWIPFVNLIIWIYLGSKGNELAWRAQQWQSVEHFKNVQKKWRPWGIAFFIFGILQVLAVFLD